MDFYLRVKIFVFSHFTVPINAYSTRVSSIHNNQEILGHPTGRTARARQIGHINEIRLKNNSNALYKHLVLKHPSQNAKFRVEILKKFMDPLSRQVDEGIRIVKVNPSLILNSKSEFNHPPITRIKIDRRKR